MNKVCNVVTKVPNGIELNEKDYCTCLLSTLKEMIKNYSIAMTEASNEWLYDIYKNIFNEISDFQRELYIIMFRNGWYQLEPVSQTKLDEKYKMFDADYKGLSE